ncbi:hypothetical protein ACFU99_28585 [Streptomyces sp. NPDC057654]|uniref:hypothetical protein n=1 Tax=Streptomyces sp. NPDC057654 TaxID=3346196 RepID=UPI00367757C5
MLRREGWRAVVSSHRLRGRLEAFHPSGAVVWRLLAKELTIAYCTPTHPQVAQLPRAYRTPRALATVDHGQGLLFSWLNWLTSQGITSLHEVTQEHCQRYLAVRSTVRDKHGHRLRAASPSQKRAVVMAIMDLAFYGDLFTSGSVGGRTGIVAVHVGKHRPGSRRRHALSV